MRKARGVGLIGIGLLLVGGQWAMSAGTVRLQFSPPFGQALQITNSVSAKVFDNKADGKLVMTDSDKSTSEITFTSDRSGQLHAAARLLSHEKVVNGTKLDLSQDPGVGVTLQYTVDGHGTAQKVSGVESVLSKLQAQLTSAKVDPKYGEVVGFMQPERFSQMLLAGWNSAAMPVTILTTTAEIPYAPTAFKTTLQTALPRYDRPPIGLAGIPLTGQWQVSNVEASGGHPAGYQCRYTYTGKMTLTDDMARVLNYFIHQLAAASGPWEVVKTGITVTVIGEGQALLDAKTLMVQTSGLRQSLIVEGQEGSYRLERETNQAAMW